MRKYSRDIAWRPVARCLAAACCALILGWAHAAEARRVALVIGNADYQVGALRNPVPDADAVAAAFEKDLGFDKVILKKNLTFNDFRVSLRELSVEAAGADLAVVYFAGHGMEVAGKNYLIPVDAALGRAGALDLEAIPLDAVLAQLDSVRMLKLVILDACRNNPFAGAGGRRTVSRGLARIEPEDSTLVVYAAKDGTTADDGAGRRHSPFTEAFLKHVATPGVEVRLLFGRVGDEVMAATNRGQQPHIYGTLGGKEHFLRPRIEPAAHTPAGRPPETPTLSEPERAWAMVKDSPSIVLLEAFRQQYGAANPLYDRLAADRIEALKGATEKTKIAIATPEAPASTQATVAPPAAPFTPAATPPDLPRLLQVELKRVGCDPGVIDGEWGDQGEAALERFTRYAKVSLASDEPTIAALEAVKAQSGRICPLECGAGTVERDGACVTVTPPYRAPTRAKPPATRAAAPPPRREKPSQKAGGKSGMCWAIERQSNTLVPCSDPRAGPRAY